MKNITKADILKEIDRTAKENNGIPLGQNRFAKETGIQIADWRYRYWVKWSEAVIEAGYPPNKLQAAYNEEYLIEQLIAFVREIDKIPSAGEIRFKARQSSTFPNEKTISRLGSKKSGLATRLLSYCEGKPQYSDIAAICRKEATMKEASVSAVIESNTKFEYVYLMKSGHFYKIGRSAEVERRNYELGIKMPEPLEIVHKIRTEDPKGIEDYWHRRFQDKRKRGEWFELSSTDIRVFKSRKSM